MTGQQQTWTFFGHWKDDHIVVEYSEPGDVPDDRRDTGQWEQGLWAAAASGPDEATARTAALDEYEDDEEDGTPSPTNVLVDGPYTYEQVKTATNRAADDIITAADLPETGVRDALSLLVSATLTYLTNPDANLHNVAAGYDDEKLSTILSWFS